MKTKDSAVPFYKIKSNDFLVSEDNFSFEKIFVLNDKKTAAGEKEIFADDFAAASVPEKTDAPQPTAPVVPPPVI